MTQQEYDQKIEELQAAIDNLKKMKELQAAIDELKKMKPVDVSKLPDFEVKEGTPPKEEFDGKWEGFVNNHASKYASALVNAMCNPQLKGDDEEDSYYDDRLLCFGEVRAGGPYAGMGLHLGEVDYSPEWVVVDDGDGSWVLTTKQNVKAVESGYKCKVKLLD